MKKYISPKSLTIDVVPEGLIATSPGELKKNDTQGTGPGWFSQKKDLWTPVVGEE